MSIASAITNLQGRVADAYDAVETKGGTLPATQNTTNLPDAILSIPSGGGGGYTVTFADDFEHRHHLEYYPDVMPIILEYADGTTETIDVANVSSVRGLSRSGVIAIHGGTWILSDYSLEQSNVYSWYPWGSTGFFDYSTGEVYDRAEYAPPALWMNEGDVRKYVFALEGGTESIEGGFYTRPCNMNTYKLTGDVTITNANSGCRCYLKGTLITLADGKQKPVEEITYEDKLLVWDFDNGCHATAYPLWIKKPAKSAYYFKNTLSSGKVLFTTGQSKTGWGHRMFDMTKGQFRYTTESVSDMIMTLDGPERHQSCERMDEECEYYNIITEYHMNLYANRILTSCSYNNIYPVKQMKFVKDDRNERPFEAYDVPVEYYKGLRLAEQKFEPSDVNDYVANLIKDGVSR